MHRYSSLSAYIAHYHTLRNIPASSQIGDDRDRLAAMELLLGILRPEEREAIVSQSDESAIVRHRERASMRLRRELLARGALES